MTGTVVNYGQLWFIKSLIPECRELSDYRRILQKQYENLAGLSSSSIVRVFALQDVSGAGLSIIMEYVDGRHARRISHQANKWQRKRVAGSLVIAVAGLHAKGVTHLDLKPQNITIRGSYDDPEVVIIDFNLSDSGVFQYYKEVRATRDYAAPEQFDVGYEASPTADVRSLGKLLTEIAPGRNWNAAIRRALCEEPAPAQLPPVPFVPFACEQWPPPPLLPLLPLLYPLPPLLPLPLLPLLPLPLLPPFFPSRSPPILLPSRSLATASSAKKSS